MAAGRAPAPTTPRDLFAGRHDGLDTIAAALVGAAAGHGSLVLVSGEAGIGKTRLADEALRAGDDDRLVLWGSCSEGDGAPPFWPWSEALRPLVGSMAMPPEVVALLPGLAPEGATPPVPVADEIRFRAFNLVADLLDDLGRRRPVAVVLDDLHWADPSSLELLRTVARRVGTAHFAVVATYRDTDVEADHPLHRHLGELARSGSRVSLTGLTPEEVALLLQGSDEPVDLDVATDVASRTGGNPFFVREVGRAGAGTGVHDVPPAVRDVLGQRIDLLSPAARDVLEASAVAGNVDAGLSADVLALEPLAVLDAIDELVQRGLLGHTPAGEPRFAHALVRETALDALPARRTVELHGRTADAIEARSGAGEVDAIAHHRVQSAALDPSAAVRWAAEAGRAARRQLAYEQAVRWFERAVSLAPPGTLVAAELLIELADSAGRTAAGLERGREAATAAADIARSAGATEVLAQAAIAFGGPFLGILTAGFAEPEPVALADEALLALPEAPSLLRARLLARVATALGYTPDHHRALAAADASLHAARAVGDDDALIEAFTAVTSIWDLAEAQEELLDELEVVSRRRRSREGMVTVTVNRCLLALERGDRRELDRRVAQLAQLLRELHLPVHGAYVGLFRAMLHRLDGRYGEAEGELLAALGGLGDQAVEFVPGAAQLMIVWNEQDRLAEILPEARRLFGSEQFAGVPSIRVVLAYLEAVAGDPSVAAEALPGLAAEWATTQRDPNWLMGLSWLCRTAVVLDDQGSAARLLDLGRPHAGRSVLTAAGTITLGVVGMWLAEVAIAIGRHDEAAGLLAAAEEHYRGLQDRGHLVECELLRGRLAAATGQPDAAALLGAAAAAADALGMVRVARLARSVEVAEAPAPAPAATSAPEGTFRREGDVWLVRFGGVDARVRDVKGMGDLAVLLARPGVEVHVAELVGAAEVDRAASGQAVLDDTAIAAYRTRLRDLAEEEDAADAVGDAVRSTRARAEREAITDQLAADLGLGGTARRAPDWVERARKAVRRRVADALRRIEAEHPTAGRHLHRSVRTGAFCAYDPAEPVSWEI